MWIRWILGAALACTLAGCSSGPDRKPPPLQQRLHTSITDNGSKMFVFQMVRASTERAARSGGGRAGPPDGGGRGGRGGGRGGKGGMDPEKMLLQAHEALQQQLEETGFCREGYMTLDEKAERGLLAIRGECTETATQQDREQFGGGQLPAVGLALVVDPLAIGPPLRERLFGRLSAK